MYGKGLKKGLKRYYILRQDSCIYPVTHNIQWVFLNVEDASLVAHVFRVSCFRSEARILPRLGKRRMVEQANRSAGVRHMRGPALNGARFPPKIWKLVRAQSIVGILRPRSLHMCSLESSRYEGRRARQNSKEPGHWTSPSAGLDDVASLKQWLWSILL